MRNHRSDAWQIPSKFTAFAAQHIWRCLARRWTLTTHPAEAPARVRPYARMGDESIDRPKLNTYMW
jgi:hypothetical protein